MQLIETRTSEATANGRAAWQPTLMRSEAGPQMGANVLRTSRVLQLPSGDRAVVVIERVASRERSAMKPVAELLTTSLDSTDGLVRKGRAYEYLSKGGDPAVFDDQAVLRVVLPKWQHMGSPLWPVEYRFVVEEVA